MGEVVGEQMLPLNRLERAVLEKMLAGDSPVLATLRKQLSVAAVARRELTGVGFFCTLSVSTDEPSADIQGRGPIGDVEAEIEGLNHGAGFLLWLEEGRMSMLEGFSYDEPWPAEFDRFTLRYHKDPRGPFP